MDWRDGDAPRRERPRKFGFGGIRAAFAAPRWSLIAAPLMAPLLIGAFLMLATPRYSAEAQVSIGAKSNSDIFASGAGEFAAVRGQAALVGSRDLARRAIKELGMEARPEFDPLAGGLGAVSRTLIFLGLMRDPARMSLEERVLKSYQERLSVSAPGQPGVVTIAFLSEDGDLAANAVNRIADLYIEMHAAAMPGADAAPDARIVSRASAPGRLVFPNADLLLALGAAAASIAALAALGVGMARRGARAVVEGPVDQPRALGQEPAFARIKDVRLERQDVLDAQSPKFEAANRAEAFQAEAAVEIAGRILSARRGGAQGARIVVTSLAATGAEPRMMRALGRLLAREGRSIVIGLDEAVAPDFWRRPVDAPRAEAVCASAAPGLGALLSGRASFEEVIRRDPASRLHFVPIVADEAIDLQDVADVVEVLARTYDFILLIAPPFDRSDMAKTLAAKADFVVLSAQPPGEGAASAAQAELIECGAREVLVIGMPVQLRLSLGQDAA